MKIATLWLCTAVAMMAHFPLHAACDAETVKGRYVGFLALPIQAITTLDFDGVKKAKVQIRVRENYEKMTQESVTGSYKMTATCNGVLKFKLDFGGGLETISHKIDFIAAGTSGNPELIGLHTILNGGSGQAVTFTRSQF